MSNITTIKIVDSGLDYYTVEPKKVVLGRMYDNIADKIQIIRPNTEQDSLCTMIVTDINGAVIDHIIMENDTWEITNNVSQVKLIKIGFSFSRKNGYVKNSEIIIGEFLLAQKPDGFVPVEPEQKKNIDFLISYGFTDSKLNGNELEFYNMNGEKVVSFDLSPFTQEQSDLGETDVSRETFVKGKKTSNLLNDGEDGTSPFATQKWTQDNAGKIDSISVNGKNIPADKNKNVNLEVLEKTGGTLYGNLSVQGNLNVAGTTVTKDTETLLVKDNIVVTNSDKVELLNLSGLAINKNANQTYGIMYDPTTDSVKLGLGSIDETGKFTFSENGNPVAVRADSSLLVDGHLIKWDATNNRFVDSGKSVDDFVLKGEIKQDYQIVTAEPTDKSEGKMIYLKLEVPLGKATINKTASGFYSKPDDVFSKLSSGTATASDLENYEYILSSNNGYIIGYINLGDLSTLAQYAGNTLTLYYKINNGEEQSETLTKDEDGWFVGNNLTILTTSNLGVSVPSNYFTATIQNETAFAVATTDTIEITRLNLGGTYITPGKIQGSFDITNLKIADGTQYKSLKDFFGQQGDFALKSDLPTYTNLTGGV